MAEHSLTRGEPASSSPPLLLVAAAFTVVYLVWGSTYLAIRFAIETMPPFLMAGARYFSAGVLLFVVTRLRHSGPIEAAHWRAAAIVGTLMLLGGNGLVCWAEQVVPSGLAALLIATVPLWLVVLDWLRHQGPRPTRRIVVGLMAGLSGVAIPVGPSNLGGERINFFGAAALLMACLFWSLGSLHSRRAKLPASPFVSTAMQMLAGGAALLLVGTLTGEWASVDVGAVSFKSVLALAYLSVFGSILALTAYTWLLRVATAARVGTYAYVNPVVAMFLGYALADEPLSPRILTAAVVILGAVVLITSSKQREPATQAAYSGPSRTLKRDERGNFGAPKPFAGSRSSNQ